MDINSLNLQKFEGRGSKTSRWISVTKSNSFGFPPAFFKENRLDKFSKVNLYFDPNAKVVGIKFLKDGEEASFALNKYGKEKKGASVVAKSFFSEYGIQAPRVNGRYEPTVTVRPDIGKVFLIQLEDHEEEFTNKDQEETGEAYFDGVRVEDIPF